MSVPAHCVPLETVRRRGVPVKSSIKAIREELLQIKEKYLRTIKSIDQKSADPRRHKLTLNDGRVFYLYPYMNRHGKALRDWLRKWGAHLKAMGFTVRSYRNGIVRANFVIEEAEVIDEDDVNAQFEGKHKKIFSFATT
jgi:hypothetical protein